MKTGAFHHLGSRKQGDTPPRAKGQFAQSVKSAFLVFPEALKSAVRGGATIGRGRALPDDRGRLVRTRDGIDRMNLLYQANAAIIRARDGVIDVDRAQVRRGIKRVVAEADREADHRAAAYGRKLLQALLCK